MHGLSFWRFSDVPSTKMKELCKRKRNRFTGCRGTGLPFVLQSSREEARTRLRTSYEMVERQMAGGGWAVGGDFSLADCAAAPALFYGNRVEPLGIAHGNVSAYLARLEARPSFARVLKEAEPWFQMFPKED